MRTNKLAFSILSMLLITAGLSGCKKDDPAEPGPVPENPALQAAFTEAVSTYAKIVHASYEDAHSTATVLKNEIIAFTAAPSQSGLEACKQAWLAARIPYGQTEVYRFYAGPIDNDNGPEGLLNAWPMDEAFIDYVEGNASAGIINDLVSYPVIDADVLEMLNESGGETNVSVGYHAIEFLLWGQDLSTTGPGERPYTDYLSVGGTADNQERRSAYLNACGTLLVDHLGNLVAEWAPGQSGNYRGQFVSANARESVTSILQGMGFLSKGELAGERMEVAYETQLQEDEHSCFSDNTHMDIQMNAKGIRNVLMGSYTRVDGSVVMGGGINELIAVVNGTLATNLVNMLNDSQAKCEAIPAPFDQQIIASNPTGRALVQEAIVALKNQGDQIALAANSLSLSITIE